MTPVAGVLERIRRLNHASDRLAGDADRRVDYDAYGDGWFKTEDTLSLCGTPYWHLLDEPARRRLAFLEVARVWSMFVDLETVAVNTQSGFLWKELSPSPRGVPREIQAYWTHFNKEELSHTLMFRHALRFFGAPPFSTDVQRPRLLFAGLGWIAASTIAAIFEWFAESSQQKTSRGAGIHPIVRQVVASHHLEEARHIRFGREVAAAFWFTQSKRERDEAMPLLVAAMRVNLDDLSAHPDVLRLMAFEQPELRDVDEIAATVRGCDYRVAVNGRLFGEIFRFLREVGIYDRSTAPVFARGGVEHYFHEVGA